MTKKYIKRLLLILISLFPVFSIVSCLQRVKNNVLNKKEHSSKYKNFKTNKFSPLDFNILKNKEFTKNEPLFLSGINYTAYSQGFSFFLNVLRELGWNWEDEDKIKKIYDNTFNFDSIHIEKDSESLFNKTQKKSSFEIYLSETINKSQKKVISKFITNNGNKLISNLYNQINFFVLIYKNKKLIESVDSSTGVEIQLGSDFSGLNQNNKMKRISQKLNNIDIINKIFQNKKYAYSWSGEVLRNFGFQIQNNKIIIWHLSKKLPFLREDANIEKLRSTSTHLQKWISPNDLRVQDRKNLSQVFLDPISADSRMEGKVFYSVLNLTNTSDTSSIEKYLDISKTNNFSIGQFDWSKRHKNVSKGDELLHNIARYSTFIDGNNPGTTILKMYEGLFETKTVIHYPLPTLKTKNRIQSFYRVESIQKQKYFIKLIQGFIDFIKLQLNNKEKTDEIAFFKKYSLPISNSLFEFINNNNINLKNLENAFNAINNGSHYMLAVEIFFRGMINIPDELSSNNMYLVGAVLFNDQNKLKSPKREIVGMSNTSSLYSINFMMYSFSKKSRKNKDEQNNFNPWTLDYDTSLNHVGHFLKDLSSSQKTGTENY